MLKNAATAPIGLFGSVPLQSVAQIQAALVQNPIPCWLGLGCELTENKGLQQMSQTQEVSCDLN